MKDARFVFGEHVVPLVAPIDSIDTNIASPYVNLKDALHCTFFAYFGVLTATSSDNVITVTIEASTSTTSNATEVAIPFKYRLSGVTGVDTWGVVTSVANTGVDVSITGSGEGHMLAIDVDPAAIEKLHGERDAKYVRLVGVINDTGTVTLNAIWAVLDPMYPQTTHLSTS